MLDFPVTRSARVRRLTQASSESWRALRHRVYRDITRNPASKRLFLDQEPTLSAVQERIVQELETQGIATVPYGELFQSEEWWQRLSESAIVFANSKKVQEAVQTYQSGLKDLSGASKNYLVRLFAQNPKIPYGDPWLHFTLQPQILDVVNTYLGLWAKLNYADLWYTIPAGQNHTAVASQNWHRDPEDDRMVKVFMYFTDVDQDAGPLEYLTGTTSGGPYYNLWRKFGEHYPPEQDLWRLIPQSNRITCTGSAGTIIFCDTVGIHRGGFAKNRARILGNWAFVTPASIWPRRFQVNRTTPSEQPLTASEYALV